MGGALTHIIIGVVAALIIYHLHVRIDYALAMFIGNVLPDSFGLIAASVKQGTFNIVHHSVIGDPFFQLMQPITHNILNWFVVGVVFVSIAYLFYHFHYIKEWKMERMDLFYLSFFAGIMMHLLVDLFFKEASWLI